MLRVGLDQRKGGIRLKIISCSYIANSLSAQAIDVLPKLVLHLLMPRVEVTFSSPLIVGSFGNPELIRTTTVEEAMEACDILEIRLDLIVAAGLEPSRDQWAGLAGFPLLFTARRKEEGSPVDLGAHERTQLLQLALEDAALIDIEVASLGEMSAVADEIRHLGIPLVASYHDFAKLPPTSALETAASLAKDSGAAVFKAAARMSSPSDIARLADFQIADQGIPVSTMGMGALAAVSRLLCAQSGSVLNYGYIGDVPTAPGQWSARFLKQAVRLLTENPDLSR